MKDITVSQGYLYATITEAVLYGASTRLHRRRNGLVDCGTWIGLNLTLFAYYLSAAPHNSYKGQSANNVVKSFVCLIFFLSTAHLVRFLPTPTGVSISGFSDHLMDRRDQFGKSTSLPGNPAHGDASAPS